MKIKPKNYNGFTVVEGLLLVLILSVISFGGYYVWNSNKQANKSLDSAQKVSQSIPESKPVVSTPKTTQKYLTIKEWGVKVPEKTGNLISYQIRKEDNQIAEFVSSEQKDLGGDCGQFSSSRYDIFRVPSGYNPEEIMNFRIKDAKENNLAIKVGTTTYYIFGDMSGGDCTGTAQPGDSISPAEITANKNLLNSLKGLVKS